MAKILRTFSSNFLLLVSDLKRIEIEEKSRKVKLSFCRQTDDENETKLIISFLNISDSKDWKG